MEYSSIEGWNNLAIRSNIKEKEKNNATVGIRRTYR